MKKIIALGGVAGLALGTLAGCQPAYAAPTDPDADAQCAAAWPGVSQGASDDGECALGGGTITTDTDGNGSFAGHGSWQVSDGDTTATSTDGTGVFTGTPNTTYIVGFYGRSDVPGANACDTLTMTAVAVPSDEPSSPAPVPSEKPSSPAPVPSDEPSSPAPVPSEEPSSPVAQPSITPTAPGTTPGHGTVVPSTQDSESDEPAAPKADDATTVDATADESSDSESPSPEAAESTIPQATPSVETSESPAPAEHHGLPRTGGSGTAFALGTLAGLIAATASLLALGYRASKER